MPKLEWSPLQVPGFKIIGAKVKTRSYVITEENGEFRASVKTLGDPAATFILDSLDRPFTSLEEAQEACHKHLSGKLLN